MNRMLLGIGVLALGGAVAAPLTLPGAVAAQVQRESQPPLGTVAKTTREGKAKGAAATAAENKTPAKSGSATKATSDDKSGKTTAKKYTNEDLYVRPRPTSTSSTTSSSSSSTTYRTRTATGSVSSGDRSTTGSTSSGDRGKDEAYWRARAEPIRRSLQESTNRLNVAKKHLESLKSNEGLDVSVANGRTSPNQYEQQRLTNQVMELEAQVRRYEQGMKSLEDEGRRAGALPGWFR